MSRLLAATGNDTKKCFVTRIEVGDEFSFIGGQGSFWVTSVIVDNKQSVRLFLMAPNTPLLVTGLVLTLAVTLFMALTTGRMAEIFQCDL